MPSQNEMILKHMQMYGGITSSQAWAMYGCTRLSARIADLRGMGIGIESERVSKKNRFGEKVYFNRYTLIQKKEEVKDE